jgi:hypothetical protein
MQRNWDCPHDYAHGRRKGCGLPREDFPKVETKSFEEILAEDAWKRDSQQVRSRDIR